MQNLIEKAQDYCLKNGHKLTKPRARVLEILLEEGKPLGAYQILEKLSLIMNNPKPPTVYRAIQFWQKEGFIHSLDSLNSYVACCHEHHVGQTKFLLCKECDFAKELNAAIDFSPITKLADLIKFSVKNYTVEIKGLCADCHHKLA